MSTKTRFPWVNVWMIAFSAVGIWLTVSGFMGAGSENRAPSFRDIAGWVLLGVILLVAFWRLPKSLFGGEYDGEQMVMNDLGGLYLAAWRKLWRQKWILWLFGLVCLVSILGMLTDNLLTRHYLAERLAAMTSAAAAPLGTSHFEWFVSQLRWRSAYDIYEAPAHFFPSLGLARTPIGQASFVLLVLIPLAARRLRALEKGSAHAPELRFMRGLLGPLAIVSAAAIVALIICMVRTYADFVAGGLRPSGPRVAEFVSSQIWSAVLYVVIVPVLIGGLAGSLRRVASRGTVTADTFLTDGARFFKPLVGVFLLYWFFTVRFGTVWLSEVRSHFLQEWLYPSLGFIALISTLGILLLMFAPYAVIVRGTGAWGSIRAGFRDWISHAGDVISFVALGITFVSVLLMLRDAVWAAASVWLNKLSPLTMLTGAAGALISALLAAFMAVAVWEFYWRIAGTESAEDSAS